MVSEKNLHHFLVCREIHQDPSISRVRLPDVHTLILLQIHFFVKGIRIPRNKNDRGS